MSVPPTFDVSILMILIIAHQYSIRIAPHSGVVSSIVAFGDSVISGSADCNISVIDINVQSISLRRVLFGHTQPITALAVCTPSRLLFSASLDGSVRGWSLPKFELVKL
jgi:WD40 repeat protein